MALRVREQRVVDQSQSRMLTIGIGAHLAWRRGITLTPRSAADAAELTFEAEVGSVLT